jgi:hypothetical protein
MMDALVKAALGRVNESIAAIEEDVDHTAQARVQGQVATAIRYVDALRSILKAYKPKIRSILAENGQLNFKDRA